MSMPRCSQFWPDTGWRRIPYSLVTLPSAGETNVGLDTEPPLLLPGSVLARNAAHPDRRRLAGQFLPDQWLCCTTRDRGMLYCCRSWRTTSAALALARLKFPSLLTQISMPIEDMFP